MMINRQVAATGTLLVSMCSVLISCGTSDGGSDGNGAGQQPWSFTDDTGTTVDLDRRPTTVVSLLDGVTATLWTQGVEVTASPLEDGNSAMLEAAGVRNEELESISAGTAMQIDTEKLAKLEPDLIIDATAGDTLLMSSANEQIPDIAPVIGLNTGGPDTDSILESAERLSESLADDHAQAAAEESKSRYEAAKDAVTEATETTPRLRVAIAMPTTNALWLNNPETTPHMVTLQELGVDFTPVNASDASTVAYNEEVSWERTPGLDVDVLLSYGASSWPPDEIGWDRMPAVQAGQVYNLDDGDEWGGGFAFYSYENYAILFERIAEALTDGRPL